VQATGVRRVTRYRFLDAMGDVVEERDFPDHEQALEWAVADDGPDAEVQRVEHLGDRGDWRWAGALHG
jgi:hypothetical protein